MHRTSWLVLFGILAIAAADPARAGALHPNPAGPDKWEPWLEFGGYGASDGRSRGETNVFLPLWQDSTSMLFFQGKGKFFEEDVQEGNLAVGFRQVRESLSLGGLDGGGWNVGGWAGWDIRHTDEENTFHQVALGVEALSPIFDLRLNGYIPVTNPKSSPGLASAKLSGGSIVMVGGDEVPLHGLDGEVGIRVLRGSIMDREQALRVYAGGFYFDDDDADEDVSGPRVRAEWRVHDLIPGLPGSQLALEFQFQHDDLRDEQWEGGLRIRIPFGAVRATPANLTPLERRMTESIVRDTDLVTGPSEAEPVEDAITNVRFDRVVRTDAGDDLQTVIDDAGRNSLILVRGEAGTLATGDIIVGRERTIQGGGSTIRLRGVNSKTGASFRAPGSMPTIEYLVNSRVFTVRSHTHLAGLRIVGGNGGTGPANAGILASDDTTNVALTDNLLMDLDGDGIRFDGGASRVWVYGNTLTNIADRGIEFDSPADHIWVRHNTLTDIGSHGIDFDSSSTNLSVDHNWMMNIGDFGIDFDSSSNNLTANHNWMMNIGGFGIDFDSSSNNLTANYNVLTNIGSFGIDFDSSSNNLTANYNVLTNIGGFGIDFDSSSNNMWAIGNVLTDIGGLGIDFDSSSTNITVRRNRLTNIGGSRGIDLDSNTTNATIADNTIINLIGSGSYIEVGSNSTNVTITKNVLRGAGSSSDAINIDGTASGTVAGNRFEGDFGDDIIDFDVGGNAFTGGGNVLDATFGDQFCEDAGGNGASNIGFTNGAFCP